jgi:RNA ligase (TIGR02306 family)
MSHHQVKVHPIAIVPHDNADSLEIAQIQGYRAVVRKGQFSTGDLVAYIPQDSLVPDALIAEMGLEGRLGGSAKNRVVPVRLRGVFSQGLCLPARTGWTPGQDVTAELGVTKYEPPIPTGFNGEVKNIGTQNTVAYDIENIKNFPDVFRDGESVVMTEKLHGTCGQFILYHEDDGKVRFAAGSKGQGAKGLVFPVCEANASNVYVRIAMALNIEAKMRECFYAARLPVFVLGEIFGKGIQDLNYGTTPSLRVFDVAKGHRGDQRYIDDKDLEATCAEMQLPRVPVLYRGPFSEEALHAATNGKETLSGKQTHVREGAVVRPLIERATPELGRVQLKSVSEAYLLRKGATEYV